MKPSDHCPFGLYVTRNPGKHLWVFKYPGYLPLGIYLEVFTWIPNYINGITKAKAIRSYIHIHQVAARVVLHVLTGAPSVLWEEEVTGS